ncbi:hypothetical protein [Marinobacter sp. SS5-14b]|uniref:hypothetical protein n=1 Tax=Marinobacter sp. SS5-14b TaxID=3050456 RepID=UPI0026E044DF|nr:hypothetical protein [Marinobacter sp. SS5-14b]
MADYEDYITRDSVGGASIVGFQGTALEVDEPGVFALDILDAPNLETIHFKRLKSLKRPHLVLSNLAQLSNLVLPSGHPGAIVHYNAEKAPKLFVISGAVSEIDAAWKDVQTRLESAPGRQHWTRVVCCPATHKPAEPSGNGLVIVTGDMPPEHDQLALGADNDWLLLQVNGLRHVQVNTSGKVVLQQVPELRTINGSGHGLSLEVYDAPALKRISGTGERAIVYQRQAQAKELTIADNWKHARIHSKTLCSLNFPDGESLALHHCNALQQVNLPLGMDVECFGALPAPLMASARFYFDESSLNTCMDRFKSGEAGQLHGILSILANAHEREQVALSLQKIRELCELGVAPGLIWQTRRELAARHRDNRGKSKGAKRPFNEAAMAKADLYWHWKFPEDLAPQGWEADLKIWQYCQPTISAAADYGDIIACTCSNDTALDSLLRLAADIRNGNDLFHLAIRCMVEYLNKGEDYLLNRNRSQQRDPTLRIVRLLIGDRATGDDKRTVIAFLCDVLPLKTLVQSVPPIVHLCPGVFRGVLMALARKPGGWFVQRIGTFPFYKQGNKIEEYRRRLIQIALAPCVAEDGDEADICQEAGSTYSLFEGEA